MNIVYSCPGCGGPTAAAAIETRPTLSCPRCSRSISLPEGAILPATATEPPRLTGVGIVVVGFAASCVAWAYRELFLTFGILFATAAIDVVLYFLVPECLTCYRCGARYTGPGITDRFGGFNLETHEKHRQQAARQGRPASAGS
jgi:hypothetical protein